MSRLLLILLLVSLPVAALEGPELAKRQCRSVHLAYQAPPAEWAVIEATARKTSPGTYLCALGFSRGYLGMQELADGSKVVLFAVWDAPDENNTTDRPDDTNETLRVGVVEVGEGVRHRRFGGEGTGSQSFFDYEWKVGEAVRFAVRAKREGDLTTYTGYFYDAHRKQWQLMASLRTASKEPLRGLYSFVEDFRRNHESARIARRADFDHGWCKDRNGTWHPLSRARFTADGTPSDAIDAGPSPAGFFLQTGGDTRNRHTRLSDAMSRPEPEARAPQGLPPGASREP